MPPPFLHILFENICSNLAPKNKLFKQETFVDEAKRFYTDLISRLFRDEKEKLHVFVRDGLYLATKKIGKNNPKAEQIQADNEKRMQWNREVDRAIVSNVPETEIGQIKKEYIAKRYGYQSAGLLPSLSYSQEYLCRRSGESGQVGRKLWKRIKK